MEQQKCHHKMKHFEIYINANKNTKSLMLESDNQKKEGKFLSDSRRTISQICHRRYPTFFVDYAGMIECSAFSVTFSKTFGNFGTSSTIFRSFLLRIDLNDMSVKSKV